MKQIVGNGGWPGLIRDVLFSLFGSMLVGLAVAVFTIPNDIAPGGVSGMATALAAVSPIRVGVWTLLLNIPLLTATATFALVRFFRMRNEAEKYKYQLDMQIRQFEWMEQMVDDVRIFRHDFPKKMRPLIALLDENRSEDAKQIAEQFTDFTAQSGERFHTGNYCLDTVLFCEQQLAERVGATIDVPYHTVFPKDGIASDDIYTIFPNALDNAIEACRAVQGEKKIEFRSRFDKQAVFVSIRNPVAEDVRVKNGLPQTNKPDKASHGYGFRSLKKAAAKYGEDNVSFSVENGVFELRIFLNYTTQGGSGK